MKLLMCKECGDIFNLTYEVKKCRCGNIEGKYIDQLNAVYSGEHAVPLGFANNSFMFAVINQPLSGEGEYFKAFVIPKECDTFKKEDEEVV